MAKKLGKGQSLIEFALILPVLLFILVIVADLGRAIAARIALSNGAREGARYAVMYPLDFGGIKNRVLLEYNTTGLNVTGVQLKAEDIIISFPDGSAEPGYPVQVTVKCHFPLFFGSWFPESIVDENGAILLTGSAEMIIF